MTGRWDAEDDHHRGKNRHPGPAQSWPAENGTDNSAARSRKWWPLLLIAMVAVVVTAVVLHPRTPLATPAPVPPASTVPSSARTTVPSSAKTTTPIPRPSSTLLTDPAPTPPSTVDVGHPILGVTAAWELFGRGPDSLVRIELAKGRLTRTAVPGVGSSGPISFVVGPDRAIVRPLDFVRGFAVRDGHNATDLAGALSRGGPVIPGPDTSHIWADTNPGGNTDAMALIDWDGRATPTHVTIPRNWSAVGATSDGAGHVLLMSSDGGTYLASPGRPQLVTNGTLLAVGPTGYLVSECDAAGKCRTAVIDRATGKRRTLAKPITPYGGTVGMISPDGRTAAVIDVAQAGSTAARLSLVNLLSGVEHPTPAGIGTPTRHSGMVWSPDSRWLFVATAAGTVAVINPSTGHVADLGLRLPFIEQLAIRAAPIPVSTGSLGATNSPPIPAVLNRPLHFPHLRSGQKCPSTPGHAISTPDVANSVALGQGPVEPSVAGTDGLNGIADLISPTSRPPWLGLKTIWFSLPTYQGPFLVRAQRLDAPGPIGLNDGPATKTLLVPAAPTAGDAPGYREQPAPIWVMTPGCYGLQIDGLTFSDIIVVQAVLR